MAQQVLKEFVDLSSLPKRDTSPTTQIPSSSESGSNLEPHSAQESRPLFNQKAPAYTHKRERAEHRAIIMLKAAGNTNTEIAEALGFTTVTISNVVNQPWATEQILQEIERGGRDVVNTMLKGAAADAVARLITEMDNSDAKPSERINAADKILDRCFGKPNQPLSVSEKDLSTLPDSQLLAIAAGQTSTKSS